MADRDGGDPGRFLGVEEPVPVGGKIGVVLREAPSELDDRLAQLDGTFPGDVLAGPGPAGRLTRRGNQARGAVGAGGVSEAGRVTDPAP